MAVPATGHLLAAGGAGAGEAEGAPAAGAGARESAGQAYSRSRAFRALLGRCEAEAQPCAQSSGIAPVACPCPEHRRCTFRACAICRPYVLPHKGAEMSRTFAYCRVSTTGQTTENQVQEIKTAGFALEPRRVMEETISGGVPALERPEFRRLLDRLEAGDVLVVTKLDRLGRNAMDVRQSVEMLAERGIRVICLALGGVDLTSPAGKMTMGVIAAVAEFERDLLVERTQAGLARAKAEGKKVGRPPCLSPKQKADIARRLAAGTGTIVGLAREYQVDRATVQRAVKEIKAEAC